MNFLVTAGGTSERIDSVRRITNSATGRLGSLAADALAELPGAQAVVYVCGKTALRPCSPKAQIVPVEDTADLEKAVREILGGKARPQIDGIVHTMAVSDYRVRSVTSAALLADALLAAQSAGLPPTREAIIQSIEHSDGIERDAKVSSDEKSLLLVLEGTPKIISLFHGLSPATLIVGCKLLDGVSRETLIDRAYELLHKNHCAYVLANDLQDIHGDQHTAYLVDTDRRCIRYEDKMSIARGIAKTLCRDLEKRGTA
ncbi:MAG: phosphopantothenoylcysteine synthase [Spirochaetaceae bacterium]|jgi:phosphopantothenate-cysteine ligase|nr:phosphopantothenoylcysteine synthase [Spirochaetaceae bacterium]